MGGGSRGAAFIDCECKLDIGVVGNEEVVPNKLAADIGIVN